MRNLVVSCIIMLLTTILFAQEEKDSSKMDRFVSRAGKMIRYYQYSLPDLKGSFETCEAKVRKMEILSEEEAYFFQITKTDKYSTKTASIAYEDVLEVIKAFGNLQVESIKDVNTDADYMENKFVTDDGFQVGYYVSKGKVQWYLTLEKYGKSTIFVSFPKINLAFDGAKKKIEELMES